MAAIITDQLRILNAKNFVSGVQSSSNSYYAFIGLPNPEDYQSDWDTSPPAPKDSLDQSNDYWDTMLALKKINSSDVSQVVRKVTWSSGITYDMWRSDITRTNPSQPSGSFDIYSANYYVMNSDFRVYVCLYNNANPENNFQVIVVMVTFGSTFTPSNQVRLSSLTQQITSLSPTTGKLVKMTHL